MGEIREKSVNFLVIVVAYAVVFKKERLCLVGLTRGHHSLAFFLTFLFDSVGSFLFSYFFLVPHQRSSAQIGLSNGFRNAYRR